MVRATSEQLPCYFGGEKAGWAFSPEGEKLALEENHRRLLFEPRRAQVAPGDKEESRRKGLVEQSSLEEEGEKPAICVLAILLHKQNSLCKKKKLFPPSYPSLPVL